MSRDAASSARSYPSHRRTRPGAVLATLVLGAAAAVGVLGPPVAPVGASGAACGGEDPGARPGGGAWTCTFDDEFDATTGDATALDPARWSPMQTAASGFTTGPPAARTCYVNSPSNVSVSAGTLNLSVRRELTSFVCPTPSGSFRTRYSAGEVLTAGKFSQRYGRFEVRAKLPATTARGLQETFWLWPDDATRYGSWPASGEIDFAEFYSQYAGYAIPYVHYGYDPATYDPNTHTNAVTPVYPHVCTFDPAVYNTYTLVWTPGTIAIGVNGTSCLIDHYVPVAGIQSPAPFDQTFFLTLTQGLGTATNAYNSLLTPLPATTSVDYVRVWE